MQYPVDCDSPRRKTEYLYRAQELLRIVHNVFVRWREVGLTKIQYDRLPQKLREKYPYTPQISLDTQKEFIKNEFLPRSETIQEGILTQRAAFKISTRWNIDVGEIDKFQR